MMKGIANRHRARTAAESILEKYYINDPCELPFKAIMGAENVYYQERKLTGCLGNMVRNQRHGSITVSSEITYEPQKRFVTAHELGHWFLHKNVPNFNCDDKKLHEWHGGGSKYEIEANTFASELLMPHILFKACCQGKVFSRALIEELSNKFYTSLTATAFRFTDIGNESLMVVYSQNGFIKWYKPSSDFRFSFYEGRSPIPKGTVTGSYYAKELDDHETEIVVAQKWFHNDWSTKEDHYLNECIIPLKKLNACLTFLWEHEVNFEEF